MHESQLIPEERLLNYIHHGERDAYKKWAEKTGRDTSLDDAKAGPEDWTPEDEEDADDEDMLSEDSDYSPEFEFTAESEEDYNSDEEPPPLLHWVKPGRSETRQIAAGRFVTHSNLCESAGDNGRRDAAAADDDDGASDHSSEWWSDDDAELSVDTDDVSHALRYFYLRLLSSFQISSTTNVALRFTTNLQGKPGEMAHARLLRRHVRATTRISTNGGFIRGWTRFRGLMWNAGTAFREWVIIMYSTTCLSTKLDLGSLR